MGIMGLKPFTRNSPPSKTRQSQVVSQPLLQACSFYLFCLSALRYHPAGTEELVQTWGALFGFCCSEDILLSVFTSFTPHFSLPWWMTQGSWHPPPLLCIFLLTILRGRLGWEDIAGPRTPTKPPWRWGFEPEASRSSTQTTTAHKEGLGIRGDVDKGDGWLDRWGWMRRSSEVILKNQHPGIRVTSLFSHRESLQESQLKLFSGYCILYSLALQ